MIIMIIFIISSSSSRSSTVNFHTKNCRTKNRWVNIPKLLRWEIRRCAKKIHLRLRICLTQTPNLEIISLKIGRSNSYHDYDYY